MKKMSVGIIALTVALGACNKKGDVAIKTDEQKFTYAVGQEIGKGMKSQGIKVDIDVLSMSIQDALAGKEARMTMEEMQTAMMNMREKMIEERKKQGEANIEAGKKFLEENGKKEGIQTTDSGLQYKVISEGEGPKPKKTDVVKVHYKGTLIDGSEFDSSYARNEPAEFPLDRVIQGWIEGLQLMNVGSKYQLFVPSDMAYGPAGRPGIPANSVLIFEVELLDIVKSEAPEKPKKASKKKGS